MSSYQKRDSNLRITHFHNFIDDSLANFLYHSLLNIDWIDGIKTRSGGFTRKAMPIDINDIENNYIDNELVNLIRTYILKVLKDLDIDKYYNILGTYLNYYENGNNYTPNHKHIGQHQMILSLGETRTLIIKDTESSNNFTKYKLNNGDVIFFGSQLHGVPKEPKISKGRISIATFMIPVTKI
jgi:hypothetical protein